MHYDGCHDCWHDLAEVKLVAQIRPLVGPHWVNHNCNNLPSIKTIAFGNFWQFLATCGSLWQLLVTSSSFCQLLATFDNFWQLLTIFDNFWQLWQPWQLVVTCGNLRQLVVPTYLTYLPDLPTNKTRHFL